MSMVQFMHVYVIFLIIQEVYGFFRSHHVITRVSPLYYERKPVNEQWFFKEVAARIPDHVHKVNPYMCKEPTYMERAVAQNADMMLVVHPAHIINVDQIESLHKAVIGDPRYFRVNRDALVKQLDGTKFTIVSGDISDTNLCFFFEDPVQPIDENFKAIKNWVATKLYINEPVNILLCKPSHAIRLFANNGKVRK